MKEYLIKNLSDGPRDYPLKDGSSIYLGLKGVAKVQEEKLSEALRLAEEKGLIQMEEAAD